MSSVKTAVESLVSRLGYPEPVTKLIDKAPVDTNLSRGQDVSIDSGCRIRGTVSLSDDVHVGPNTVLNGNVRIGDGTNLNGNNVLRGSVDIGKYSAISPGAEFRSKNHSTNKPTLQLKLYRQITGNELEWVTKGDIEVGSDVWIGARAIVLSGVEIGHGAIIGAGAVVTSDVEPYAIVAGVPAEQKKWRFPEHVREQLLDIEWWEWPPEKIRRNKRFFEMDLQDVDDVYELVD